MAEQRFKSHVRRYRDSWVLGLGVLAVIVAIWLFSHRPPEPVATVVQVKAAVRNIEVVGAGVARIEIQLDSLVLYLENVTTLKAQLDSCQRGL